MGLGGVSMSELLIVLLIVALLFGTRKLGTIGTDLGAAISGFRRSMKGEDGTQSDLEGSPMRDDRRTAKSRRPGNQG